MAEADEGDKSHDPTQKRLDDARAKGQIARSPDLLAAMALLGFVIGTMTVGGPAVHQAGQAARLFLERPEDLLLGKATMDIVFPLLPMVIVPALPVILLLSVQRGVIFTPSNLSPQLSRIDPIAAARRRFGSEGLADFIKGVFKLTLVSIVLGVVLTRKSDGLFAALTLDPGPLTILILHGVVALLVPCLIIALMLGVADLLWQMRKHIHRNRMSRQELVEEQKDAEGDPQTKMARRMRAQDIAMNRMMSDLPKADVVIVNPTHYAVALKWDRGSGRAPVCLAKGTDEVALRMRTLAVECGIPIHSDPPTARAIHATIEIGQSIHPDHYIAVAAAMRFAAAMRRKKRGLQ